ncbi:hypothetical protein AGDE_08286 [Angomonas deanei]|nr:hypothetical protein AGDE_08286 [Angomonas deanei]|eukprot:EPY33433.1 hypothetical protein AGDE_08286 [Angomonas deanei]
MTSYHAVLMVSFIMEVLVMFIYIPMNGVVIRYANNLFYNYFRYHFQQFYPEEEAKAALDGKYKVPKAEYNLSIESASRVGGLMAQAMVWRTSGSFLYSIFKNFTYNNQDSFKGIKPHIPLRYYMLICAIGSCVLLVQVLFLTKPKYFLDYRRSNLKDSTVARMYNNILYIKRGAVSQTARVVGSNFMFVLCFIFIYFALPDALYTTYYSFNGAMGIYGFSKRWTQSNSIVSSLGALVGCALYAAWMYAAHLVEHRKTVKRIQLYLLRKREAEVDTPAVPAHPEVGEPTAAERLASREQDILNDPDYLYEPWRANPFVIVLAGCIAWTLGIGFHFIGQMGSNNDKFNYRVFFIFQSFIAQMCLQFAFMPTLSLAALHAPFEYETAAFELYSVCTMGGGNVSSTLSFSLLSSLNATVTQGYWKFLLLTMFFRMFPMFIAPSLPKNREEVYLDRTDGEVEDMKREPFREAHSPVCAEESMSDRESDENSHYNVAP